MQRERLITEAAPTDHDATRRLSVLIVSWNAADYLASCLTSLREAAPDCLREIIVVDNASFDGSPEMVESQFPEVRLVRAPSNLGFARANNLAMGMAVGSEFALVNSDALVHPGCLERLLARLDARPDVGMVGPRVIGGDGHLQRTSRRLPGLWNTLCRALALDTLFRGRRPFNGYEVPHADHDRPHDTAVLSGCFCVVRRQAVQQAGMLDERFFFFGEDIDWCRRLSDAGWKLCYEPEATATHFGGGSTSKAPLRYSVEILRATLQYWRKHHRRAGYAACMALLVLHHALRLCARSVMQVMGPASATRRYRLQEDLVCLRWLLFRVELQSTAPLPSVPAR